MSNPYRALAAAVILQAVADYRELRIFLKTHKPDEPPVWLAWRNRSAVRELREIEAFLLSEWFRDLTRISGRMVLIRLREEEKRQVL